MNIDFSRKEFTRLVELVYMAEQLSVDIDGEDGPYAKRYGDLIQKIYTAAAEDAEGRPEYVEEDEDFPGEYRPSLRLETDSPAASALEKYENHVFWEELISRLAERDVHREDLRNPPPMSKAAIEDQLKREERQENRYREEFVKNDLNNVFVMFGSDRLS